MPATTILVCTTCRHPDDDADGPRAGARLHQRVQALAAERGCDVSVAGVECLSVCKRPCTVGLAAPGKWTYVYGDFPVETGAATILDAAVLFAQAPDGLIPWRQRPDALKKGVVARIPAFMSPFASPHKEAAE
jgi:predicted metal-binding protein